MEPVIAADSCLAWCDAEFASDETLARGTGGAFEAGNVVFCKIDEVLRFFERLRLTRKRIVLVTGEGDLPCNAFRQKFLPANVIHWFATNVTSRHPRVTALPLGLGPQDDQATLSREEIARRRSAGEPRDKWLFVNFRPDTNPAVRQPVYEHFRKLSLAADWVSFEPPTGRGTNAEFLNQLVRHRFVLCPEGNGVDTHRFWETLAAGGIPIALRSVAMEPFQALPALFVDDFREVTIGMLEKFRDEVSGSPVSLELAHEAHWEELVRAAGDAVRECPVMPMGKWFGESLRYGAGMVKRRWCRTNV